MTKKVYVLHENLEWTRHLVKWLEEYEVPYELWDLSSGTLDLGSVPPEGVFYNRMSASSHTRGHRFAPEFTQQVIKWLEFHGRKVFNGSSAIDIEISKIKQYLLLEKSGITHPKTVAVLGRENLAEASNSLTFPILTKHNRAGKGLGIHQFENKAELAEYAQSEDFEESADGITLLQEYIKSADGHVRRSEFIGGKFFYTVAIDTQSDNAGKSKFELCPADECVVPWATNNTESEELVTVASTSGQTVESGEQTTAVQATGFGLDLANDGNDVREVEVSKFQIIDPLEESQKEAYEQFLKDNNLDIVAMEWLEDEAGNKFVYDINTNTNYNSSAEDEKGLHAHQQIAQFLKKALEELD